MPSPNAPKKGHKARTVVMRMVLCGGAAAWLWMLVLRADDNFNMFRYLDAQMHPSTFIEEQYVDPTYVERTFPENKRNLTGILMEPGESSA